MQLELRALPPIVCPDAVYSAALARIDHLGHDRPARPSWHRTMRPRRWRVGLPALALLVVVTVLLPTSDEQQARPVIAQGELVEAPTDPEPAALPEPHAGPAPAAASPAPRAVPAPAPSVAAAALRPSPASSSAAPPQTAAPTAEAEAAREGALLALALVAEANRHATSSVRANVDDQLDHVTDALSHAILN